MIWLKLIPPAIGGTIIGYLLIGYFPWSLLVCFAFGFCWAKLVDYVVKK